MKKTAKPRSLLKPLLSVLLCLTLIFGLLTSLTSPVQAKSSRTAVIKEMAGDVTVQSAGGSKAYDAYEGMNLNQGDLLKIGDAAGSYALVDLKDAGEMTYGQSSEVYISQLAGGANGKESKFKMWAGSVWASVKKLAGGDSFEVETSTAVMGVQGTQYMVSYDPKTGGVFVAVAAGAVKTSAVEDSNGDSTGTQPNTALVLPAQQLDLNPNALSTDLTNQVSIVDLTSFVEKASPKVIEALVRNKVDIDAENQQLLDSLKNQIQNGTATGKPDSTLSVNNLGELNKVSQNLNNLIGNVVNTAIQENKVDKNQIQTIISQVNQQVTNSQNKLDLNNVKPLDKTAGVDPEQEKKRLEEQQRIDALLKQQQVQQQQMLQQQQQMLADAIKKLQEETLRLALEKQKAIEEAKMKAEQQFLQKLTEDQKKKFEEDKKTLVQQQSVPPVVPTPTPPTSAPIPPSLPSVLYPTAADKADTAVPYIKVQSYDATTVNIYEGNSVVNTGAIGADHTATIYMDKAQQGTHTYKVSVVNGDGLESGLVALPTIRYDATAPVKPVVTAPSIVNTSSFKATVSAEDQSSIRIYEGTAATPVQTATGQGTTPVTVNLTLPAGVMSQLYRITASDAAGNVSDAATFTVSAALASPTVVYPISTWVTMDPYVVVSGTVGQTVKLYEGDQVVKTKTIESTSPVTIPLSGIVEGEHHYQVSLSTDTVESAKVAVPAILYDKTAPAKPVVTGPSSSGSLSFSVNVNAEIGSSVRLYAGTGTSAIGTGTVAGTGSGSGTVAIPVTLTTSATIASLYATSTDAAGNQSTGDPYTVSLAISPSPSPSPSAPTLVLASPETSTGYTPVVKVTATSGASIVATENGTTVGFATGIANMPVDIQFLSPLEEGTHAISITASLNGVSSQPVTATVTIVKPTLTWSVDPTIASDGTFNLSMSLNHFMADKQIAGVEVHFTTDMNQTLDPASVSVVSDRNQVFPPDSSVDQKSVECYSDGSCRVNYVIVGFNANSSTPITGIAVEGQNPVSLAVLHLKAVNSPLTFTLRSSNVYIVDANGNRIADVKIVGPVNASVTPPLL